MSSAYFEMQGKETPKKQLNLQIKIEVTTKSRHVLSKSKGVCQWGNVPAHFWIFLPRQK